MQLINDLNTITKPFKNAVVTTGNFDGVHIGHQALFHEVIERADALGGTSVAITFDPHPIRVLKQNGHPPLITLLDQKSELIESTGVDILIVIPFSTEFATLSAHEFIADILVQKIGMQAMVVGSDYSFGRNREGNLDLLKQMARDMGFEVILADWIQGPDANSDRISSTRVRELVMAGDMARTRKHLGRYYQIRGRVATGRNRGGRLLGFPTANINLQDELSPKTGVYAVTVECQAGQFKGVANIGYSPTFDDHIFTVEVHILDFEKDIYGEDIRVNFIHRLRAEIKFSGIDELSKQINTDILHAREILENI
ncbi:MAG: bifunctional riboflavin kinase/FAD synthetase [Desulfobacterales bacterium]|nr:bifunctional riboflavin kinase/FAD synthetase [Desulfobacterales bacterium]